MQSDYSLIADQRAYERLRSGDISAVHYPVRAEDSDCRDECIVHILLVRHSEPFLRHIAESLPFGACRGDAELSVHRGEGGAVLSERERVPAVIVYRSETQRYPVRERRGEIYKSDIREDDPERLWSADRERDRDEHRAEAVGYLASRWT